MKNPNFDLEKFSELNLARCEDPQAFNCGNKAPTYFGCALSGEAGEVGEILKKLERGFNERDLKKIKDKYVKAWEKAHDTPHEFDKVSIPEWKIIWETELRQKLGDELADVFTYLDLICSHNKINLFTHVKRKFNTVSEELNVKQYSI